MKKIVFSLLLLSTYLSAQRGELPAKNTLLIQNLTNEEFTVCVHETNHDTSRHLISLEPGEIRSFIAGTVARINGPLHFARVEDMNKDTYPYYEVDSIFPIMFYAAETTKVFGIKKVGDDKYVITPGNKPVTRKETTKEIGF